LFVPRIYYVVLFFAHISFVVNHTFNTTSTEVATTLYLGFSFYVAGHLAVYPV